MRTPQPSYRIDALLVGPLADLPEFFKDTDAMPLSMVGNLAFRNLLCGQKLGLPSGERAAVAFGVPPLGSDVLWNAGSRLLDDTSLEDDDRKELKETRKKREAVRTTWVDSGGPLAGNTPLWYYVLREAEYYGVDRDADDDAIGVGG